MISTKFSGEKASKRHLEELKMISKMLMLFSHNLLLMNQDYFLRPGLPA